MQGLCRFDSSKIVSNLNLYNPFDEVPQGDENALVEAIRTKGAVAVAVKVTRSWYSYAGGIFQTQDCSNLRYSDINNGVVAVGYGRLNGQDYYIIRNSWGTGWGLNGYMLLARNKNNQCNVASWGQYPIV